MNRVNRRTDETYGGRAGRDMETEVGPVTLPFTSLFMNGPGLSPLVTSVVRYRLHTVPSANGRPGGRNGTERDGTRKGEDS